MNRGNGQFTATLRMKNLGTRTINKVYTRVQDNGETVGRTPVVSLAPGETKVEKVMWTITKGEHTVVAHADPNDHIKESDESNNVRTRVVTK